MATFLVTGASTGIGEACVLRLSRSGHRVFAGVRKDSDAERLASEGGHLVVAVPLDVTDGAQVEAVRSRLQDELGPDGLDGLVNNAGIARGGPIEFIPLDEWRDQLEVNVLGQIAVTQAMIPLLRQARGRVVFMGSMAGRLSMPMLGPYSASKHAIEAIGESLREELRPWGISVSIVEPGAVRTPIWTKGQTYADELEARLPTDARDLYGDAIDALRAGLEEQDRIGIPPDRVAAVVEQALTHRRPRHRYLVGRDAHAVGVIDRFLPDRAMAALVRRLSP